MGLVHADSTRAPNSKKKNHRKTKTSVNVSRAGVVCIVLVMAKKVKGQN